jgi:hypothetical protein
MGMVDNLKKLFGIATVKVSSGGNSGEKIIHPGEYDQEAKKLFPVQFPDDIQRLYKLWLSDALDSSATLKDRMGRVQELSYAYYNSTIISIATRLFADESLQADDQDQILNVYSRNSKVEKYINEFFDKIGMTNAVLKSMAHDLALYADHFWVLSTDPKEGITKITPIDVTTIKDRIEFNAIQVAKLENVSKYRSLLSKNSRLSILTDLLEKDKASLDYSKYFQSYLFGYQIEEDIYLPPWNILHFRVLSHGSEFYPFGRPILINCLSPFKQLQTAKNLMAIARANNFPIKLFKVKVADSMTAMDQWQAVTDAREQYENLMGISNREQFSVNGAVWIPDGALQMEAIELSYDMDKIADIEMLKMDLADGTGIPADFLSSSASSWGKSGQSLLQQSKLFARGVFTEQTAIIDGLVELVKLQFAMTGDFDEDEDFEISLNFPVEEEDSDKLRQKSDSVDLAKTILDNLGAVMGIEGAMPTDVVKDILGKMSFLTTAEINRYIKSIEDQKAEEEKAAEEEAEEGGFGFGGDEEGGFGGEEEDSGEDVPFEIKLKKPKEDVAESTRSKVKSRLTEGLIREVYFKSKKNLNMSEGVARQRHYVSSWKAEEGSVKLTRKMMENYSSATNKLDEDINNEDFDN